MAVIDEVPCPCCGNLLYRAQKKQTAPDGYEGPPFESEGETPYIRCRHCDCMIVIRIRPGSGGTEYDLAAEQPCKR